MSRYYEYDYDRNCIIGFGSDMTDTDEEYHYNYNYNNTSVTASESGDSVPNSYSQSTISPYTSPSSSYSDLKQIKEYQCDPVADACAELFILEADTKTIDKNKLIPLDIYEPFLLVSDMIKLKKNKVKNKKQLTFSDISDDKNTDANIIINKETPNKKLNYESYQRLDDFNGNYYNLFGKYKVSNQEIHIWKFQILGNSPAILGIIESKTTLETLQCNGAYFGFNNNISAYSFNTITAETYNKSQQPIYQQMLQSGLLDKPMIIDMKLDLKNGILSITNQTTGSQHFGKEILLFKNINKNKSYKLAIALLGNETINLF